MVMEQFINVADKELVPLEGEEVLSVEGGDHLG